MATNKTIKIDIIANGLDTLENGIKRVGNSYGDISKYTESLQDNINKARTIMKTYGTSMPVDKAKELKKYLENIAKESSALGKKKKIEFFDPNTEKKIKETTKELEKLHRAKEKLDKEPANINADFDKKVQKLKTQKTTKGQDISSIQDK
jgi:DNA repair ATPase RecN